MSTRKHPKPGHETQTLPADDLECDPGIGSSRGMSGADPDELKGEHTLEGDVANDVTPTGAVDPQQRGRTNR